MLRHHAAIPDVKFGVVVVEEEGWERKVGSKVGSSCAQLMMDSRVLIGRMIELVGGDSSSRSSCVIDY